MTMRTTARLFSVALLSLGLITGCASTEESADTPSAAQTIADAKAANAEAAALNNEWRDTGSMIEEAEKKLAAGDEEGALALAQQKIKNSSIVLLTRLPRLPQPAKVALVV